MRSAPEISLSCLHNLGGEEGRAHEVPPRRSENDPPHAVATRPAGTVVGAREDQPKRSRSSLEGSCEEHTRSTPAPPDYSSRQSEWLTVSEVAVELKVSPSAVYRALATGQLPGSKPFGRWRIRRTELEEWLNAQRRHPMPDANRELVPRARGRFRASVEAQSAGGRR